MNREQLHKSLSRFALGWAMTGSRAICVPTPLDTDEDYIVLVQRDRSLSWLADIGFVESINEGYDESWMSAWRLDYFNVVITDDPCFFDRFSAATLLAGQRNILGKEDRLMLFKSIIYAPSEYPMLTCFDKPDGGWPGL